jgi:hypothetical protein
MRESRTYGFVRGAPSDRRPYRDPHLPPASPQDGFFGAQSQDAGDIHPDCIHSHGTRRLWSTNLRTWLPFPKPP